MESVFIKLTLMTGFVAQGRLLQTQVSLFLRFFSVECRLTHIDIMTVSMNLS